MGLEELKKRAEILEKDLQDPNNFNFPEKLTALQKEYQKIKKQLLPLEKLEKIKKDISETEKILTENQDPALLEMAQKELADLKVDQAKLEKQISGEDEEEERNVIMEIRAGAGGDEAALFVFDLFRMYSKYAERKGWSQEILSSNRTGLDGLKEISLRIMGEKAWSKLKNEGGVHRVQRIPVTEKAGRVHTSTVSVAVLPEADDAEVIIKPEEIKVESYRSSGHGGQNVQKVETAIRIFHLPTGLIVTCQEERQQAKNKDKAFKLLRTKLFALEQEKKQKELGSNRKAQIGSAMRAEKIRTYNFPQNRVTDHRLNKSWHNIDQIIDGDLDSVVESFEEKK